MKKAKFLKEISLEVGDMVRADPYEVGNNPVLHHPPFVGIYLGFEKDPSGWRPRANKVLGPDGYVSLWGNQWHLEKIPEIEKISVNLKVELGRRDET